MASWHTDSADTARAGEDTRDSFLRYSRKYQNEERVARYDTHLFTSLKGRAFVAAEKKALAAAFSYIEPGAKVLDLPCGTGRITEMLLDSGFRVVGADISPQMLAAAGQKLGHYGNLIELRPGNAVDIQAEDGEFDAAVSVRFLADIPLDYQAKALAEMGRVTRDVVIAAFSQDTQLNRMRRKLKNAVKLTSSDYPVDLPTLRNWAASAGLVIVDHIWPIRYLSEELILVMKHA